MFCMALVDLENLNCKFKFRSANDSFVQTHSMLFRMNSLQVSFQVAVCFILQQNSV